MNRTIYTTSKCLINGTGILTQSVNFKLSKDKSVVNEFGNLNTYRQTNDPEISSLDVSFYPTGHEAVLLNYLKTQTESSNPIRATVDTNLGGLNNCLLTSIKGSASVGSVPTLSLSFIGAFNDSTAGVSPSSGTISNVKTTENISADNNPSINIQKLSFSWDIPVQAVLSYSESLTNPTGFFGNPPGNATFEIEGINQLSGVSSVQFGNFSIGISSGVVVSSGVSLAVGQLAANHSLSLAASASNISFS